MAGTPKNTMPLAVARAMILPASILYRDGTAMLLVCNQSPQSVRLVTINLRIGVGPKALLEETCSIGPVPGKSFLSWRCPHKVYTDGKPAWIEAVVTGAEV